MRVLSAQLLKTHASKSFSGPAEEAANHAASVAGRAVAITQESSRDQADLPGDQGVPQVEACIVNCGKTEVIVE